jgi:hypothetical protein
MSIEGKHAYRFGYLKSEEWKNVRIEALAREKGKCQICGEESISNDAHHVWYPESIWDTREMHLVILCRPCHDFIHTLLPECKTNDEDHGRREWLKFKNTILEWRRAKLSLFLKESIETAPISESDTEQSELPALRTAFRNMKVEMRQQQRELEYYRFQFKIEPKLQAMGTYEESKQEAEPSKISEVRLAYRNLRQSCRVQKHIIDTYRSKFGDVPELEYLDGMFKLKEQNTPKVIGVQVKEAFALIEKCVFDYLNGSPSTKIHIDKSEYQI